MTRSTVIATCLVNSNIVNRMEDAENLVKRVFADEFPNDNFHAWNLEVNDKAAQNIIRSVGRASRINVKSFIDQLRRG